MAFPDRDPQLLKGVLPMLVLRLLGDEESYGWELVARLQHAGLTDIATGTVYPVLSRLEREGHVSSRLVASSSGPARKYYRPTPDGEAELARAVEGWTALARTVAVVLGAPSASLEPPASTDPVPREGARP